LQLEKGRKREKKRRKGRRKEEMATDTDRPANLLCILPIIEMKEGRKGEGGRRWT